MSASSPDNAKRYHDPEKQKVWIEFSEQVINSLVSERFPQFQKGELPFLDLLIELGKGRSQIATTLLQGEDDERRSHYGELRTEGLTASETFSEGVQDAVWVRMAPKVFEKIDKMFKTISDHGKVDPKKPSEIVFFSEDRCWMGLITYKDSPDPDPRKDTTCAIAIRTPETDEQSHPRSLATIYLYNNETPRRIVIEYAKIRNELQQSDFELAAKYLNDMLKIDQASYSKNDEYISDFLQNAGKFCHLMANLLPFKLGTAGITEWIIRAAAHSKGIKLGDFNHEELISWDFEALTTPNRDEYAKWFSKKAFTNPELATPDNPFRFYTPVKKHPGL